MERFNEEGAFDKLLAAREDRKTSKFQVVDTAPAADEAPDVAAPGVLGIMTCIYTRAWVQRHLVSNDRIVRDLLNVKQILASTSSNG